MKHTGPKSPNNFFETDFVSLLLCMHNMGPLLLLLLLFFVSVPCNFIERREGIQARGCRNMPIILQILQASFHETINVGEDIHPMFKTSSS